MTVTRLLHGLVLVAVALALSSCGDGGVKNAPNQIAARVNGREISVHQVNSAIARGGDVPPGQAGQATAAALERVIEQELLVQEALKAKLDRDPQVMKAIEDARRTILAKAYIERAAGAAPKENRQDIGKFYKENPALFERRRVYRVHELVVAAPQERIETLKAAAGEARNLSDVAGWLKSQDLPFTDLATSRPAEQIPLDILQRVFEMRDGQIAVFPTARGASVIQLLQSGDAPLSERQAAPLIEQFLLNRRRLEFARAETRRLRDQATIEYVGKFDRARRASSVPSVRAAAAVIAPAESSRHIENGLAGLR